VQSTLVIAFIVTFPSLSVLYSPFSAVLIAQGSVVILSETAVSAVRTKVLDSVRLHLPQNDTKYHVL
jgi:hypothetical protein